MSRKLTPERQARNDRWGFGVGDNTADGGLMMEDGVSTESEREQAERELNCAVRHKALDTRDSGDDPLYLVAMDLTLKLRAAEKALDGIEQCGRKQGCCPTCKGMASAALAEIRRK